MSAPAAQPSGEPNASVAVVLVTYFSGDSVSTLLDSLAAASTRTTPVVLADNGSTDGAPEKAAERPGVTLLRTGANLGYGKAANLGIRETDTEWVLVANPDIVFLPGAIDALLDTAARWPRAGAIGPLIRTPSGEVYPSARALPTLGTGIGHALCGWWWPSNPWTAAYRQDRQPPSERTVGWLSGSCVLLRREAFDSVDGFDPGYFMYFEDVDLGDRLGRAGWLNVYAPSAEVVHVGAHSTAHHRTAMADEHHASAMRYLARRYPGRRWMAVRAVLRVGLRLRALLSRSVGAITGGATYQDEGKT